MDISEDYLTSTSPTIYYSASGSTTLAHRLLNLKKLSDDNKNITDFVVKGTIDFGFLVDPDMNCLLYGMNSSLVNLENIAGNACGVIVGRLTPGTSEYKGNMLIDKSVTFVIKSSSNNGGGYGVYFYSTVADYIQTINGTFTIIADSGYAYGIYFGSTASGSTTINGTFNIASTSSSGHASYGVYFNTSANGSTTTINGTFTISSNDGSAYGVYFNDNASGSTQTINGTFSIYTNDSSRYSFGVYFYSTASGSATINGTFTIAAKGSAYGVYFYSTAFGSTQTINGTFTISSINTSALGVYFYSTASGSLTMSGTNFFSNKDDSSNVKDKYGSSTNWFYQWNGTSYNRNTATTVAGDGSLKLKTIYDTLTDTDSHFNIKVIDECGSSGNPSQSKKTFNTAYKNALDLYVKSSDCPTTAKGWLESIINKIVIPS